MRRRALRHGHAGLAGRLRAHLGHAARAVLADGDRAVRGSIRSSSSWPRSTGTWNGRCSSRASTTPTTSGCTIASATGIRRPCEDISTRASTTRTAGPFPGEPRRAASGGDFPPDVHEAAAVITFLSPGLRFFHQGQFEGRVKRISPHLVRGPNEPVNSVVQQFYERLLEVLRRPVVRRGRMAAAGMRVRLGGEPILRSGHRLRLAGFRGNRLIVTVNYANHQSQCYVRLPFAGLAGGQWRLRDQLGTARYDRDGDDLESRGLYLDVPPWQCHVFEMTGMQRATWTRQT